MGCDIHFVVEGRKQAEVGKLPPASKWVGMYSTCLTPRMKVDVEVSGLCDGMEESSPIKLRSMTRGMAFKNRDYDFFAAIAGVRGYGAVPKGLPADMSELTRIAYETGASDWHTPSHLPLEEFALTWVRTGNYQGLAAEAVQLIMSDTDGTGRRRLMADLIGKDYLDEDWEYRVVFWFDN